MATRLNLRFRLRRDMSETWAAIDPVLEAGEPGYELDTHILRVGNGVTRFTELPRLSPGPQGIQGIQGPQGDVSDHVNDPEPHPVYDNGPSLLLLYENAKV